MKNMAYTDKPTVVRGPRGAPMGYSEEEDYPVSEDEFFEEGKKGKGKKGSSRKQMVKQRQEELTQKNKAYDSNSKNWRKNVKIEDDQFVPMGRINPKDKNMVKEKGLIIRWPDIVEATQEKDGVRGVCYGMPINTNRGKKKCVKKIREEYRKEHAVVYTSACAGVTGYFAKKRCIKKYNRGL